MLSPEMFVVMGVLLVVISLLLMGVAQYVRGWFFLPDPRTELQPALNRQSRRNGIYR